MRKICFKWPLKKKTKIVFKDRLLLNAGQMYLQNAPMGSILQYFRPSLSYNLFGLFLSGRLRQVKLYAIMLHLWSILMH